MYERAVLAKVNDRNTDDFLTKIVIEAEKKRKGCGHKGVDRNCEAWLGGNDHRREGKWVWITGGIWTYPMRYTNWDDNEPNNHKNERRQKYLASSDSIKQNKVTEDHLEQGDEDAGHLERGHHVSRVEPGHGAAPGLQLGDELPRHHELLQLARAAQVVQDHRQPLPGPQLQTGRRGRAGED